MKLNTVLAEEYSVRRRMLLKRVDVTIQVGFDLPPRLLLRGEKK